MNRFDPGRLAASRISAVDLFCGAGGLTHGLLKAGIRVEAGIDLDPAAEYAYIENNQGAQFLNWDVSRKKSPSIGALFAEGKYRLLAGCAPCQPFSKLTNGISEHGSWDLLDNFARFVNAIRPELVTMENVPELARRGRVVFEHFVTTLERAGYHVDWRIVNCTHFGAPQSRKRLVLLASQLGAISVPAGRRSSPEKWKTVRQTIGRLPPIEAGSQHPRDPLHIASLLSPLNLRRIRATPRDGGTKSDWPRHLVLECHRKRTGSRYHSIYGRMWWDKPAPTMTTLCNGIGNGRFGHPEQDRAITLREAALLQTFPRNYAFWPRGAKLHAKAIARMIGNAVPPQLARALGQALVAHVTEYERGLAARNARERGRSSRSMMRSRTRQ
jgi:DNA (cytosine-5)-methyltransferase 1